jgi:hypothetical protein
MSPRFPSLDEIDLKSSTSKIRSRLRAPNPTMIPIFFLKIKNGLPSFLQIEQID